MSGFNFPTPEDYRAAAWSLAFNALARPVVFLVAVRLIAGPAVGIGFGTWLGALLLFSLLTPLRRPAR